MSNSKRGGRKQSERHLPYGNEHDGMDQEPQLGSIYEDSIKRTLLVEAIDEERGWIYGWVMYEKWDYPMDYDCTEKTWKEIWRWRRLTGEDKYDAP